MITNANTHWVFLCGILSEDSIKGNIERHYTDIAFGCETLLNMGVKKDDIDILIDSQSYTIKNQIVLDVLSRCKDPIPLENYENIVCSNDLKNLIIIVFGHGSIHGLNGSDNVKPFNLVSTIHKRLNIKFGVVVFGQCFSGIYNFVDLITKNEDGNPLLYPQICFMGASNLNSSISSPNLSGHDNIFWAANPFLFFFFEWLSDKHDIDGDGKFTLIDAFKYAGGKTSQSVLSAKEQTVHSLYKAQKRLDNIRTETPSDAQELEIESLQETIQNSINIKHLIQDPWFLNANKAREIEFI